MEKVTVKDKVQQVKGQALEKMYPMLCSTGIIVSGMSNVCFAGGNSNSGSSATSGDASGIINNIGNKIYEVFKYIGFILTLWGIGQLILAFKNEDADSKSRAIMCIVSGVILFALQSFAEELINL